MMPPTIPINSYLSNDLHPCILSIARKPTWGNERQTFEIAFEFIVYGSSESKKEKLVDVELLFNEDDNFPFTKIKKLKPICLTTDRFYTLDSLDIRPWLPDPKSKTPKIIDGVCKNVRTGNQYVVCGKYRAEPGVHSFSLSAQ